MDREFKDLGSASLDDGQPLATDDGEYFDALVYTRNGTHDRVEAALNITREFIAERALLLVGGMAIDYALRLKGDRIYSDSQMPDYDAYSPNHVADAGALGEILCKRGFREVSVIQAVHITSMRVRVDFEVVADITYCPASVFKTLPFLKYENLHIIHPHYQMIDQHASLSMPWTMAGPQPVIFHRWLKDMKRYDKLYAHYPVVPEFVRDAAVDPGVTLDPKKGVPQIKYRVVGGAVQRTNLCSSCMSSGDDADPLIIDASRLDGNDDDLLRLEEEAGVIIEGGATSAARGYVRSHAREQKSRELELPMHTIELPFAAFEGAIICGWSAVDYVVNEERGTVKLQIPAGQPVSVACDDYKEFIARHKLTNIEYFAEYFGKLPRHVKCDSSILNPHTNAPLKFEIFDTFGIKLGLAADSSVCNLQFAMLYLLVKIFTDKDPHIIFTAEEQYIRCRVLVEAGATPSIEVYGRYNYTHSFLNSRRTTKERLYNIKATGPPLQPKNMYLRPPACAAAPQNFDPEQSEYFMTDGRALDGFIEWVVDSAAAGETSGSATPSTTPPPRKLGS